MSGPQQTLEERGISLTEFDPEAVQSLDDEINELDQKVGLALRKEWEALKERRQAHQAERNALIKARAYLLQEVRSSQPGDVRV